jgi:alkylation response protein AidB-like acyl-CoA dehydrogenase
LAPAILFPERRKSLGGKPKGGMKVKAGLRWLKWDPESCVDFGAPLPHPICLSSGWRKSVHVGRLDPAHVSMLKMNNVWMAMETARKARDILGANGIVDDYCIMRHMNNLESVYTYEGTHDIHRLVIGERITGIPAYF